MMLACLCECVHNSFVSQKADVCSARCVVIIGNEFKSSDDNLMDSQDSTSDLYIVLAALEVDSVMNLYLSRCKKKRLNSNIPCIIQEVYNPTTVNFLPDEYTMLSTSAIRPWYKFDKVPLHSGRGIDNVDCNLSGDEWEPPRPARFGREVGQSWKYFVAVLP